MKQRGIGVLLLGGVALGLGCQPAPPQRAAGGQAITVSPSAPQEEDRRQSRSAPDSSEARVPESRPAAPAMAESVQPPTGRRCRVYLRRDALGMAGPAPLGPNVNSLTHREAAVSGTIDQVTDGWLVVRSETSQLWIPRGNVLMIEMLDH